METLVQSVLEVEFAIHCTISVFVSQTAIITD